MITECNCCEEEFEQEEFEHDDCPKCRMETEIIPECIDKFKQAMKLLNEIAEEFPSSQWKGECLFEDFEDSLSQDQKDELSAIHNETHWKPFNIFM